MPPSHPPSLDNRLPRDVQPHHPSPPPSKRDGLHPQMTLKVQQISALKSPKINPLVVSEPGVRIPPPVHSVERTGEMNRGPLIPVGLVGQHHLHNPRLESAHSPIKPQKQEPCPPTQAKTKRQHPRGGKPTRKENNPTTKIVINSPRTSSPSTKLHHTQRQTRSAHRQNTLSKAQLPPTATPQPATEPTQPERVQHQPRSPRHPNPPAPQEPSGHRKGISPRTAHRTAPAWPGLVPTCPARYQPGPPGNQPQPSAPLPRATASLRHSGSHTSPTCRACPASPKPLARSATATSPAATVASPASPASRQPHPHPPGPPAARPSSAAAAASPANHSRRPAAAPAPPARPAPCRACPATTPAPPARPARPAQAR